MDNDEAIADTPIFLDQHKTSCCTPISKGVSDDRKGEMGEMGRNQAHQPPSALVDVGSTGHLEGLETVIAQDREDYCFPPLLHPCTEGRERAGDADLGWDFVAGFW